MIAEVNEKERLIELYQSRAEKGLGIFTGREILPEDRSFMARCITCRTWLWSQDDKKRRHFCSKRCRRNAPRIRKEIPPLEKRIEQIQTVIEQFDEPVTARLIAVAISGNGQTWCLRQWMDTQTASIPLLRALAHMASHGLIKQVGTHHKPKYHKF